MWTLNFADPNGSIIHVEIQGGDGELTGAAEPLVTREQQSDDIFSPVCYQTGYLNIIDVNADGIRPESTFDRPVKVTKDGKIVFVGYIAVEEYTNDFGQYPATLNLPLISGIGVLKNVKFIPSGINLTVWELLRDCLNQSFTASSGISWTYLYWTYYNESFLLKEICDLAFDKSDSSDGEFYDGFNPNLPEESEGYTVLEVISEICKLFGFTIHEDGNSIYLVFRGASYNNYYQLQFNEDDVGSRNLITASISSGSPASTSMSISRLEPKKQVRITAKTHPIPEEILTMENVFKRLAYKDGAYITDTNNSFYWYDMYTLKPDVASVSASNPNGNLVAEQLGVRELANLTNRGAVLCKDYYYSPPDLEERDIKPTLTITVDTATNVCACLVSERKYFFWDNVDCFINLKIEFETINWWQEDKLSWKLKDDEEKKTNTRKIYGKLNCGSLWYNGTSWQSEECIICLNEFQPQLPIYYPLNQADGMIIPAPKGQIGKFRIFFCSPLDSLDTNLKYLRVTKVDMSLKNQFINKHVTAFDEKRYNDVCDNNAAESYTFSQNLFFTHSSQTPYLASYNSVLDDLPSITEDEEYGVLAIMKSWYSHVHSKLEFEAIGTDFKPAGNLKFLQYSGIIASRQIHWRDNKTRITLLTR